MLSSFESSSYLCDTCSGSWDYLDMVEMGLLVIQMTVSNVFGFTASLCRVVRICIKCLDSQSIILWLSHPR